MKCSVHVFKAPKEGNTRDEYEDACFPPRATEVEAALARFAVADGATESAFSKLWARILVRAHALGWLDEFQRARRLPRIGRLWSARVTRRELPWNLDEKVRSGSFAAFLGLTLTPLPGEIEEIPGFSGSDLPGGTRRLSRTVAGSPGRYLMAAIGDCCAVQIREDEMIESFPVQRSADFNNWPTLLSTRPEAHLDPAADWKALEGGWQSADEFYLMTDALACWFLFEFERGRRPWRTLRELSTDSFPAWLEARRKEGSMKNDDVTLVRVVTPDHQP